MRSPSEFSIIFDVPPSNTATQAVGRAKIDTNYFRHFPSPFTRATLPDLIFLPLNEAVQFFFKHLLGVWIRLPWQAEPIAHVTDSLSE